MGPEMNRSRGVHSPRYFYYFLTPNSREDIVFRKFPKIDCFFYEKNLTFWGARWIRQRHVPLIDLGLEYGAHILCESKGSFTNYVIQRRGGGGVGPELRGAYAGGSAACGGLA